MVRLNYHEESSILVVKYDGGYTIDDLIKTHDQIRSEFNYLDQLYAIDDFTTANLLFDMSTILTDMTKLTKDTKHLASQFKRICVAMVYKEIKNPGLKQYFRERTWPSNYHFEFFLSSQEAMSWLQQMQSLPLPKHGSTI